MIIPDRISPIVAYRTWGWDSLGLISLNGCRWIPGEAMKAICSKFDSARLAFNHDAPTDGCSCGVYAAKNLKHLHDIGYCQHGDVNGEIYLWGKVWDHQLGYRAEFAYPKNMVICARSLPFTIPEIETHLQPLFLYNVDISLTEKEYEGKPQVHFPLYKKDEGIQPDAFDWIVNNRKKWYTYEKASLKELQVGDRVAVLGEGLGIVDIATLDVVHVKMYNKLVRCIEAKNIKWNRQNFRWETDTKGTLSYVTTMKRLIDNT
jgi:hypothetical protein